MASAAQKTANKQNAQRSTGPISEAGRAAVAQNATKHGLTGAFVFEDEKEIDAFDAMRTRMLHDYKPGTITEGELISEMAHSLWRSRKALLLQDMIVDELASELDDERIPTL